MASILPGYEYDIFISYRQKDNQSDQWVTNFVQALREEIDATFKEDISIYFDANPHDGLLETHDVDQSLNEKVKCLVFIPIVSQTYCDPNCYAWQKEFLAFRNFAKQDEPGLDIKLASGNVAKRILPVRIHEIDQTDLALFEKEIDGAIRSVDFIYQSAGVNRPLRANEEHPDDNINRTIYRDQVNKVANAVKEIIEVLKSPESSSIQHNIKEEDDTSFQSEDKTPKRKGIIYGAIGVLLIILAVYFFYNRNSEEQIEIVDKSIAVLPFTDIGF